MDRIEVFTRQSETPSGWNGFGRRLGFESATVRLGETRIAPRAASPWHHHGLRTVYGFVVEGEVVFESGRAGRTRTRAARHEFFRIPGALVHRDVNPVDTETLIVNLMVGEGPPTTDVSGPEE